MRKIILLLSCLLILICSVIGQSNKGIHLQGIARNDKGIIIPNKQIDLIAFPEKIKCVIFFINYLLNYSFIFILSKALLIPIFIAKLVI